MLTNLNEWRLALASHIKKQKRRLILSAYLLLDRFSQNQQTSLHQTNHLIVAQ
jgi:hypothetical protein